MVDFFFRQEKTSKDSIYCCWVLKSMDCLQLPAFIHLEEAVSWFQRFLTRKILPKTKFIYDKQIWKQMFAEILHFK